MNVADFQELEEPKDSPWGWYVSTGHNPVTNTSYYLYPDLELHHATGSHDIDVWPGFYSTEVEANKYLDLYYAKHATPVIKQHNEDAWERAMKGI